MTVEIKLIKKINLKNYTLLEGFPGVALIGTIATGYLAEKKESELIGYVISDKFPPMASIHKGAPMFPARLYANKKKKICMLFSEFVVPASTVYDLADEIIRFAKKNKMKKIIALAGMKVPSIKNEPKIYGISSQPKLVKELERDKVIIKTHLVLLVMTR